MHKTAYLVLTFIAGVIVGCFLPNPLTTHTAQAQPAAAAKWEYKIFDAGAGLAEMVKELNDDGRWEYSGYAFGKDAFTPLFKRQRK